MRSELIIFMVQVVIHLEPNESKVRSDDDQGIGDQYEGINQDGLRDAKIDDESKVKVHISLLKNDLEYYMSKHIYPHIYVSEHCVAGVNAINEISF